MLGLPSGMGSGEHLMSNGEKGTDWHKDSRKESEEPCTGAQIPE